MPNFEENALYVGGKCSKKLAKLKNNSDAFMSENAKTYAGLFYRWLLKAFTIHIVHDDVLLCAYIEHVQMTHKHMYSAQS